jgi:hypothetical protein
VGVLLWVLDGATSWLEWLGEALSIPVWLLIATVGTTLWLFYLVIRSRRLVFVEGAYYAASDNKLTHPYCMHCLEHAGMLVSARRIQSEDGAPRFECVTHLVYGWDSHEKPSAAPRTVKIDRRSLKRSNV